MTHDVLMGQMAGTPKPDAVLLILDATNLARHLVLAAPVLALGLPTLVVLNMADELKSRGGDLDPESLAKQLGAPVALTSAARGEGLTPVREFLDGALGVPASLDLPVLHDVPACREWAAGMGERAGYSAPAPPVWTRRLDAVFLHPVLGPAIFLVVVVAVFQTIFTARAAAHGPRRPAPSPRRGRSSRRPCRRRSSGTSSCRASGAASAPSSSSCRRSSSSSSSSGSSRTRATSRGPR